MTGQEIEGVVDRIAEHLAGLQGPALDAWQQLVGEYQAACIGACVATIILCGAGGVAGVLLLRSAHRQDKERLSKPLYKNQWEQPVYPNASVGLIAATIGGALLLLGSGIAVIVVLSANLFGAFAPSVMLLKELLN